MLLVRVVSVLLLLLLFLLILLLGLRLGHQLLEGHVVSLLLGITLSLIKWLA